MKFTSFYFQNYKGIIEKLTIQVSSLVSLVGNNESGKTTILQGIELIGKLCKHKDGIDYLQNGMRNDIRPKGQSESFTDDIILGASLSVEKTDIDNGDDILNEVANVTIEFVYTFSNSEFKNRQTKIYKNTSLINSQEEIEKIVNKIQQNCPEIIYYDDFKFDVPDKIRFLPKLDEANYTQEWYEQQKQDNLLNDKQNKLWVHIFDDLLNGAIKYRDNKKHTFQDEIIDWTLKSNKGDVEAVLQRIKKVNNYLNKVVNNDWKDIIGSDSVFERFYIDVENDSNAYNDGFVDYIIRASTVNATFKIPERSKGCRWYFCFKIYTEIRSNRNGNGTIFLLDEPASNLHIHPQEKILQSLVNLSKINNINVIYSTHSPYLVNTDNLNSTFIVWNKSNDLDELPQICLCTIEDYIKTDQNSKLLSLQPVLNSIGLQLFNKTKEENMSSNKDILDKFKKVTEYINCSDKLLSVIEHLTNLFS